MHNTFGLMYKNTCVSVSPTLELSKMYIFRVTLNLLLALIAATHTREEKTIVW